MGRDPRERAGRANPSLRRGLLKSARGAIFPKSSACPSTTRATPPLPSGLSTEASPSRTSNQSLPKASRILGLWVTTTILVPAGGPVGPTLCTAWERPLFLTGVTPNPPLAQVRGRAPSPRPVSVPVLTARLETLP